MSGFNRFPDEPSRYLLPSVPPTTPLRRPVKLTAPHWLRRTALVMSGVFAWSMVLAMPVTALTHMPAQKRSGVRPLTSTEMQHLFGQTTPTVPQAGSGSFPPNVSAAAGAGLTWDIVQGTTTIATNLAPNGWSVIGPGPNFTVSAPGTAPVAGYRVRYNPGGGGTPAADFNVVQPATSIKAGGSLGWEAGAGAGNNKVNTVNGNKIITVPIVRWTQRGGLPVSIALVHNSQSNQNTILGQKWTHTYDIYGLVDGSGNFTIHWGDDLSYVFTKSGTLYAPPVGFYDTLVKNVDGTYTLTTKGQTAYHFNLSQRCDSITDENSNTITLGYTGNLVTTVTDTNSRALTIHYDASNRIDTITDPLSRQWTLAYNASNELITLTLPLTVVGGTAYTKTFAYNTAHDITDYKDALGKHSTFSYNADDSTAWEQDALSNRSTWSYAGAVATKTDPNGYTQAFSYTSGRLSQVQDNSGNTIVPTYDTSNNKTQVQDQRGKLWNFTYDTRGNALTAKDPYTDTTTYTYNSHNKLLTAKLATGEETDYTYDIRDRLTQVDQKDTLGTIRATETYTVTLAGITTDYYDANSHRYQYGHNTNGELTSLTTPLSRVTTWGVNGIGVRTSRQDALLRTTTYTLDGWLRVTKEHYPTGTDTTLTLDANSNLTGWTDSTGTYTRAYDDDNRLLNEKKGTATIVSHTYDATGQKGLLSTTTDANSRVLTYSYDGLNRLSSVAETAGTTSYGYDATSHETSITNANGTTVTKPYDDAGNLTSVTNKNSTGTVLSSFSYVYDTDNRRKTCTEASGDVVTYGYDWGSRLTTESRTGTNAYSLSYIVDGVGNRTSQTKGTATTTFTLDSDDQLNSTASSTGGFVNSYSYNANGEQTGRTLSGTAYTVAFDYDGRQTSITQGANVTSYTYDGLNRRLSRTAGGTTTGFLYDSNKILLEKQGSTTTATYAYGNALVRKDGETPLFDGLGSERTVTSSTQTVTGTLTMDGFGNQVASTGSSANPYMFAATSGYRNDGDAGLTHVGARYYDAQVGRFTTRDTQLDQRPYLYCDHDPINDVDPTGHYAVPPTWPADPGDISDIGAIAVPVPELPGVYIIVHVPNPHAEIGVPGYTYNPGTGQIIIRRPVGGGGSHWHIRIRYNPRTGEWDSYMVYEKPL